MAFDLHESELDEHGFPMSEAMDPVNQFAFEVSEKPLVDFAVKTLGDHQDAYYKRYPDASRNGHIWRVSKRA